MASVPSSGSAAPPPPPVAPPPPVWDARPPETTVRYAGFWLRVVAAIVDGIVLWVIWGIVLMILPAQPLPALPDNPDFEAFTQFLSELASPREVIVYAVLVWAYFALQESSSVQATLGKRMLGIRVSSEEGARLSLFTATIRTWPMYLPTLASLLGTGVGSLVGLIGFVACVAVAFSARKQGLHDKMADAVLTRT